MGGADLIHTGPVFGNLYNPHDIQKNVAAVQSDWIDAPGSLAILSRSAAAAVQDSLDFLALEKSITNPMDVMFLVDKDVYQYADTSSGSIQSAAEKFVSVVRNAQPATGRSKAEIFASQGIQP